jgi:hypothetical protein
MLLVSSYVINLSRPFFLLKVGPLELGVLLLADLNFLFAVVPGEPLNIMDLDMNFEHDKEIRIMGFVF